MKKKQETLDTKAKKATIISTQATVFTAIITLISVLLALATCGGENKNVTKNNVSGNENTTVQANKIGILTINEAKQRPDTIVHINAPTPKVETKKNKINNRNKQATHEKTPLSATLIPTEVPLDYDKFINKIFQKDIAVIIVDSLGKLASDASSRIAEYYRNQGYNVTSYLFTHEFYNTPYVKRLGYVNVDVIRKLKLADHAKNIFYGTIFQHIEPGTLAGYTCRTHIDVKIISCTQASEIDGRVLINANTFDDKQNARIGGIDKIISQLRKWNIPFE